ncbi:PH domain-containing protein [Streptomyces antibioticus]|uniref:Uncharacterized protein n=1 Tax=Streptomyces antibioticus TaxID=1890 RepID=A0AAE7CMW8_STRAT|nr:hypothetical protein [Streptomyces antibioticus]MCX4742520.1 hypothetical protein [Streptomyces antibioticus]OOQ46816.1 hypothetical protein AFM16_28820 [Streptomyces antibioticus]QIT47121.1 hypothetical protein HCX60_29355 [Streptomyces antibioticus]
MKDRQAPHWAATLDRCGLTRTDDRPAPDGPPLNAAFHAVNGFEVQPTAAVPASLPHAAEDLDTAWHHHAAQASLYDDNGEFLILPPVPGGSKIGWVRVKDPLGRNLPSRISGVTGSPEFMAASVDGRHLCAASVEESEFWVVAHEF